MKNINQIAKKTTVALAIIAVANLGVVGNVSAESKVSSTKESSTVPAAVSGATVGAIAAGPLGAIVGGIFGIMIGSDIQQTKEMNATKAQLVASQRALSELNGELIAWQQKAMLQPVSVTETKPQVLPELTTSVQFRTGQSTIESFYTDQLSLVGDMLNSFEGLSVHVSGYADPRGSDAENKKLSLRRAEAIQNALIAAGVDLKQISISGMGERELKQSTVTNANTVEDYFFERQAVLTIAPRHKILTARQ